MAVDGKMLIDAGIRDLGYRQVSVSTPYDLTLTCTNDTELQYMVGPVEMTDENGDLITPQTSAITNVANLISDYSGTGATTGAGWQSAYPLSNMFDGSTSTFTYGNEGSTTYTFEEPIPFTTLRVWIGFSGDARHFGINGDTSLSGVNNQWNDYTSAVTSPLTSITSGLQAGVAGDYVYAIEVDGAVLVDGVSPGTVLTFADNTDFEFFEAGETVYHQRDYGATEPLTPMF